MQSASERLLDVHMRALHSYVLFSIHAPQITYTYKSVQGWACAMLALCVCCADKKIALRRAHLIGRRINRSRHAPKQLFFTYVSELPKL